MTLAIIWDLIWESQPEHSQVTFTYVGQNGDRPQGSQTSL